MFYYFFFRQCFTVGGFSVLISFVVLWFLFLVIGGGSTSVLLLFFLLLSTSWRSLALFRFRFRKGCFLLCHLFLQHWPPFPQCLEGHRWRLLLGQGGLLRLALFLTFSSPFYQDDQARPRFLSYRMHLFSCRFWGQEGLYKRRSPPITQNKFFKRKLSKLTRRFSKAP